MRAFASLDLRGLFIVDEEVDTEAAGVDAAAREVSGQDRVARLKVKLGRQDVEEQDVEGLLRKRAEDANREGGLLALGPECAHHALSFTATAGRTCVGAAAWASHHGQYDAAVVAPTRKRARLRLRTGGSNI